MKLTQEQVAFIERYINEDLIDKQILIEYLEKHRLIKNDVFKRCSKLGKANPFSNSAYLEEGYALGVGKPVIQLCLPDSISKTTMGFTPPSGIWMLHWHPGFSCPAVVIGMTSFKRF